MRGGVLAVVERDQMRRNRAAGAQARRQGGPWLSRTQVGAGLAAVAAVTALAGLKYAYRDRPIERSSRRVAVEALGVVAGSVHVPAGVRAPTGDIQSKVPNVPVGRVVVMPVTLTQSESIYLPKVHNAGAMIRLVASLQNGRSPHTRLVEVYARALKEFADQCSTSQTKLLHLYLPLLSDGSTNQRVRHSDSRAFYDAYDILVYGGVVDPANLQLSNITILPRDDAQVDECRREFLESASAVTYVGGFTSTDPPDQPPQIDNQKGAKVRPVSVGVVSTAGIWKFSGAGLMMHASEVVEEYKRLKSDTQAEQNVKSDFRAYMARFGLYCFEYYDHNRTDLLALPALLTGVTGVTGVTSVTGVTPREVVVRVVRDLRWSARRGGLFGFFSANTLVANRFYLYVRPGADDTAHVASVCAGFDAMIREGVSVAIIGPSIFFRGASFTKENVEFAQGIVKRALGELVPHGDTATYSSYIAAAFVYDEAADERATESFGGVELYTVP
jgi:hypothetical protein